jgi:hypothetical protein
MPRIAIQDCVVISVENGPWERDPDPATAVTRSLARLPRFFGPAIAALAVVIAGARAQAHGTATKITGLYNTGLASTGALQAGGQQDANWSVTYASTNGGSSASTAYEGAAYVINPSVVTASGYTPNTQGKCLIRSIRVTSTRRRPNGSGRRCDRAAPALVRRLP